MRSAHWLRQLRRDSWPRTILAVGYSSRVEAAHVDTRGCESAVMDSWALDVHHLERGSYNITDIAEGTVPLQFRDAVRQYAPRGGPTWLVTVDATYFAALAGIWDALDRGEWELPEAPPAGDYRGYPAWQGCCVLADPPTIVHLSWPGAAAGVQLIDARNWGEIGWEELLAEAVAQDGRGSPLMSVGGDYRAEARNRAAALSRWVMRWTWCLRQHNLGGWRTTSASQGAAAWRRHRLKSLVLCHSNPAVIRLERDCMHCGRQEPFRLGHVPGPLLHYDFASYYPALAQAGGLPCVLQYHWRDRCPPLDRLMRDGWIVSARVQLETEAPDWPYTTEDGTIWPVGVFCTALAHPELKRALERGVVRQVFECAAYSPGAPLTDVMADLRELRAAAKGAGLRATDAALKAMANGLIGKLASSGMAWIPAREVGSVDRWCEFPEYNGMTRRWERIRVVAGRAFRQTHAMVAPEAVPAITAHIWSAGRAIMADVIEAAGRYYTAYVGTDAVIVAASAAEQLEPYCRRDGPLLTRLRLVKRLDWLRVYGIGQYETPYGKKHAGAPADATGSYAEGYSWLSPQTAAEAVASDMAPQALLLPRRSRRDKTAQRWIELGDGRLLPVRVKKPY